MGVVLDFTDHSIACAPLYTFIGYGASSQTSAQYASALDIGYQNVSIAVLINEDGYQVAPTLEVRSFPDEVQSNSVVFLYVVPHRAPLQPLMSPLQ